MPRLLHIADLHIGYKGREEDILSQLEKVVKVALEVRADLILIAGDVFHRADPSRAEKEGFLKTLSPFLQRDKGVVAISGNHDQGALGRLPQREGVHLFEEPETLEMGELALHLFPFSPEGTGRDLITRRRPSSARYQIGICHGSYISNPQVFAHLGEEGALYYPISSVEVRGSGFHYLALGHYHNPSLWREGGTVCGYPGTVEPLSFREIGPRKAFLIICEDGVRVEEIELGSQREYRILNWKVGVDVQEGELSGRLKELSQQQRVFFRVVLEGMVREGRLLHLQLQEMPPNVEVVDRTLDLSRIKADPLLEAFYRVVKERGEGEVWDRVLVRGLSLLGHED